MNTVCVKFKLDEPLTFALNGGSFQAEDIEGDEYIFTVNYEPKNSCAVDRKFVLSRHSSLVGYTKHMDITAHSPEQNCSLYRENINTIIAVDLNLECSTKIEIPKFATILGFERYEVRSRSIKMLIVADEWYTKETRVFHPLKEGDVVPNDYEFVGGVEATGTYMFKENTVTEQLMSTFRF